MPIKGNFSADHTGSREHFNKHGYRNTGRGTLEVVRTRGFNREGMALSRAVQAKMICNSNKLKITQMFIDRGLDSNMMWLQTVEFFIHLPNTHTVSMPQTLF